MAGGIYQIVQIDEGFYVGTVAVAYDSNRVEIAQSMDNIPHGVGQFVLLGPVGYGCQGAVEIEKYHQAFFPKLLKNSVTGIQCRR